MLKCNGSAFCGMNSYRASSSLMLAKATWTRPAWANRWHAHSQQVPGKKVLGVVVTHEYKIIMFI